MIDWEKLIKTESVDELKEVKLWLFQENMRLERERAELDETMDKFLKERELFRNEMNELNRRTVVERKRLKEESMFFEKKMAILQDGFRQLEEDRKSLERERLRIAVEREQLAAHTTAAYLADSPIAEALFKNVNNPLALRKRYKDLMKIFHPDNMAGDEELVQLINKEYAKRRKEE